jgi:hypothetical protein
MSSRLFSSLSAGSHTNVGEIADLITVELVYRRRDQVVLAQVRM